MRRGLDLFPEIEGKYGLVSLLEPAPRAGEEAWAYPPLETVEEAWMKEDIGLVPPGAGEDAWVWDPSGTREDGMGAAGFIPFWIRREGVGLVPPWSWRLGVRN